jgi:tetratricopeptide (TPR) repeat protein
MHRLLRLGAIVLAATFFTNIALIEVANAGEEQRAPPPTRSSDTLSDRVFRVISNIQEMMSPEDPNDEPDFVGAKAELDELYEDRFERMNDFEKSTVLNFYTNIYLSTDNIPEAMRVFEQILTIENLREDTRLRSLRALGQLKMAEEEYEDSIFYYNQWRELSLEEDDSVFLGLANSHYSLEQYSEAVPYLLSHMEMIADQGEAIERNKWSLLNVLYIEQEDYVNALEITKNMVVNFDNPSDWRNLSAIYSFLEQDSSRIGTLFMRYLMEIMDSDAEYLNLAQSLAGEDAPYSGAQVLEAGIAAGIVEEDLDNLFILIQMYQLANEFDLAVEPATKLAELDPTGDGYDNLGYIYYILHDYAASAEAFQASVDKGSLDDAAATNLFLARALVEIDRFDDAAAATRRSSDLGDESDRSSAASYLRFIEGQQARHNAIQARKAEVLDFYVSYD